MMAVTTAIGCAVLTIVFHGGALWRALRRLLLRLHVLPPEPERPAGHPLGRIAADLRRLHPLVQRDQPGESMVRRRGRLAAYDELLGEACRALGIEDTLCGLPEGTDRDAERWRVEWLLAEAGLEIVPDDFREAS
jgi:hypothetical protein